MIRCAIVDDEPLARDVLEGYVSNYSNLQLVATCKNAKQAIELLDKETIDLLFLDIQMPDLSGMNLAKSLKNPPMIVFTTAYDQYAVEGFEVNAVDYLMKPISPARFKQAIEKVEHLMQLEKKGEQDADDFFYVRADYQDVKVKYSDILYIEGLKDYVRIVLPTKKIITLTNIKGILEKLPEDRFVRVHKSYIVAIDKIDSVKGRIISLAGKDIPIGLTFKEEFKRKMNFLD